MGAQRVEEVVIERLQFGLSPRAELCDPHHVAALTEVLDEVPPIIVHAPTMRVIDGVHRVHAARSVGQTTIWAVMFYGDESEAHVEAVRSNVAHGKPLTLTEREAAATKILLLMPNWSDRRIAMVSGLSPKTVGRIRRRATVDSPQSPARVGRDGRLRPVDPLGVRQRVAEAIQTDPTASNRAIAKRTGASQGTVRDVRNRLDRGLSEVAPVPQTASLPGPGRVPGDDGTAALNIGWSEFTVWFEARHVEDAHWQPFVEGLPISRVYEVADACRQYSLSWRAFAVALEDRARGRKRSPSTDPVTDGGEA